MATRCGAARGSRPGPGPDEFTVPAEKSRLLEGSRGRIEGLFEVRLAVLGAQEDWRAALPPPGRPPAAARIWVQLAGGGKAVRCAKVRGGGRAGRTGPAGRAALPRAAAGRGKGKRNARDRARGRRLRSGCAGRWRSCGGGSAPGTGPAAVPRGGSPGRFLLLPVLLLPGSGSCWGPAGCCPVSRCRAHVACAVAFGRVLAGLQLRGAGVSALRQPCSPRLPP